MKTAKQILASALLSLAALVTSAAQTPGGLAAHLNIDANQMGGLSTNLYLTNFALIYFDSSNVAIPTNQWPVLSVVPATTFSNNITAGLDFTNVLTLPATTTFFIMAISNYNGSAVSFSLPAAWVAGTPTGTGFRLTK